MFFSSSAFYCNRTKQNRKCLKFVHLPYLSYICKSNKTFTMMKNIYSLILALFMPVVAFAAENMTVAGSNLRGPVKTYSVHMSGQGSSTYEFDPEGRLIKEKEKERVATYTWNNDSTVNVRVYNIAGEHQGGATFVWVDDGEMFLLTTGQNRVCHFLDEKGLQKNKVVTVGDREAIYFYHYDEDNTLVGATVKCEGQPDVEMTIINELVDSYGNARKQTVILGDQEYTAYCKYTYYE